jgi:hypothetical protein
VEENESDNYKTWRCPVRSSGAEQGQEAKKIKKMMMKRRDVLT